MSEGADLGAALAGLERASRDRLAEDWAGYFGAPPPPRTSRSLKPRRVACDPVGRGPNIADLSGPASTPDRSARIATP